MLEFSHTLCIHNPLGDFWGFEENHRDRTGNYDLHHSSIIFCFIITISITMNQSCIIRKDCTTRVSVYFYIFHYSAFYGKEKFPGALCGLMAFARIGRGMLSLCFKRNGNYLCGTPSQIPVHHFSSWSPAHARFLWYHPIPYILSFLLKPC